MSKVSDLKHMLSRQKGGGDKPHHHTAPCYAPKPRQTCGGGPLFADGMHASRQN